jgi:hypothetical protein
VRKTTLFVEIGWRFANPAVAYQMPLRTKYKLRLFNHLKGSLGSVFRNDTPHDHYIGWYVLDLLDGLCPATDVDVLTANLLGRNTGTSVSLIALRDFEEHVIKPYANETLVPLLTRALLHNAPNYPEALKLFIERTRLSSLNFVLVDGNRLFLNGTSGIHCDRDRLTPLRSSPLQSKHKQDALKVVTNNTRRCRVVTILDALNKPQVRDFFAKKPTQDLMSVVLPSLARTQFVLQDFCAFRSAKLREKHDRVCGLISNLLFAYCLRTTLDHIASGPEPKFRLIEVRHRLCHAFAPVIVRDDQVCHGLDENRLRLSLANSLIDQILLSLARKNCV